MATAFISPPMLRLRRSAQSGSKAMTAAWQVVYTESGPNASAYIFGGSEINLTPMQALDTINIRVRKIVVSGGAWVNHDQKAYNDAQPVTHPSIHINPIPDVYGVEVSMQQTAGGLRTIETEFYDAKRMGA